MDHSLYCSSSSNQEQRARPKSQGPRVKTGESNPKPTSATPKRLSMVDEDGENQRRKRQRWRARPSSRRGRGLALASSTEERIAGRGIRARPPAACARSSGSTRTGATTAGGGRGPESDSAMGPHRGAPESMRGADCAADTAQQGTASGGSCRNADVNGRKGRRRTATGAPARAAPAARQGIPARL